MNRLQLPLTVGTKLPIAMVGPQTTPAVDDAIIAVNGYQAAHVAGKRAMMRMLIATSVRAHHYSQTEKRSGPSQRAISL